MTGFVHVALGAALGRFIKNKPAAFMAGMGSHLLGDVVPHLDMGAGEAPLVFATLFEVAHHHGWNSPQFFGALGAICPDFEHIPAELRQDPRRFEKMEEKLFPTHTKRPYELNHGTWPVDKTYGLALNFSLFVVGLWLAGTLAKQKKAPGA